MSSEHRAWRSDHRSGGGARAIVILLSTVDLVVIGSALVLAAVVTGLVSDPVDGVSTSWLVLGTAATWMVTLRLHGGYVAPCVRGSGATVRPVVLSSVSAAAVVAATAWTLGAGVHRTFLALGFTLGAALLLVARGVYSALVRHLWARGRLERRVVVVGEPTPVHDVSAALTRDERLCGLHVSAAGVHGPNGAQGVGAGTPSVPVLGSADDVVAACRRADADAAVVAASWGSAGEMRRLSWELADQDIDLFIAPDATEIAGIRMELRPTAGLPLLHVDRPRVAKAGGVAKRAFDVLISIVAIVLLAPVAVVVSLLIKHEDHGPVYFRQLRVGRRGRPFALAKFRTMAVGAGELEEGLRREQGHDQALWKMEADPRVTRVGQFLRRTSLDELPQFFNVLLGQMSLVGPRPQQPWEAETYTNTARRRLLVRPGITGLWQVSGRSDLSLEESLRLDLFYVDNWSMTGDLAILGQTVRAVINGRGAY